MTEASTAVKLRGNPNDLIERLKKDSIFAAVDLTKLMEAGNYVGRSNMQVDQFVSRVVNPIRRRFPAASKIAADLNV